MCSCCAVKLITAVCTARAVVVHGIHSEVPKIIWSFWHDHAHLPKTVRIAQDSWATFAPDYEIHFLGPETWKDHLAPGTAGHCGEGRKFAEWLRLHLLKVRGGVWLDASLILLAPIDLLVNRTAQVGGVHIDGMNFETSFISATPGTELMSRWHDEYLKICAMSEQDYSLYLVGLKTEGIEPLNGQWSDCDWAKENWQNMALQRIIHIGAAIANLFIRYTQEYVHPCGQKFWMHYLIINVSLNAVLRTTGKDPKKIWERYGVFTQDTTKTLLAAAFQNGWDDSRLADFALSQRSSDFNFTAAHGIKLRKNERESLEQSDSCEEGSLICRVQKLTHTAAFDEVQSRQEL